MMAASRDRIMNRAWYREDLAALFSRAAGGYERPTAACRLHDQHAQTQSAYQSISAREVFRSWLYAGRKFRHQSAPRRNACRQLAMPGRVNAIQAGGGDRNAQPAGFKRTFVAGPINADRQPAGDDQSGIRHVCGECMGIVATSRGWPPAANDSNLRILSLIHISEPTRRTPISYAVFCL